MKDKYMGPVKVGPKGQIVIPVEVREMFDINSGDTLILLADKKRGIAIEKHSFFQGVVDAVFKKRERTAAEESFIDEARKIEAEQ